LTSGAASNVSRFERLSADRRAYVETDTGVAKTVCRTGLTIAVDGIVVGETRERDGRGRPLPVWQGCLVLSGDEVFVINW
jgi:type IV secretory pathway protease TraF